MSGPSAGRRSPSQRQWKVDGSGQEQLRVTAAPEKSGGKCDGGSVSVTQTDQAASR